MIIENKNASHEYEILDTIDAGIVLSGAETKSFFDNRVTLAAAHVRILSGEMYLVNAQFNSPLVPSDHTKRSRKLLVHKREIVAWDSKIKEKKLTIVPISMYTTGRFIKLKIGLGKARAEFNKKQKLKRHDIERETERDYRKKLT